MRVVEHDLLGLQLPPAADLGVNIVHKIIGMLSMSLVISRAVFTVTDRERLARSDRGCPRPRGYGSRSRPSWSPRAG